MGSCSAAPVELFELVEYSLCVEDILNMFIGIIRIVFIIVLTEVDVLIMLIIVLCRLL